MYGFSLDVIQKKKDNHRDISSTYIREEITAGRIASANKLLGYPYYIIGEIAHGNAIGGAKLSRPTINILPSEDKLLPPNGVYITEVYLEHRKYHGVTNIGIRPTVQESTKRISVETHILDFDRDVYDKLAKVVFLDYIRPEQEFSSFEELKKQIDRDVYTTYSFFNKK